MILRADAREFGFFKLFTLLNAGLLIIYYVVNDALFINDINFFFVSKDDLYRLRLGLS